MCLARSTTEATNAPSKYCFSTATKVTRTRLTVTFTRPFSCLYHLDCERLYITPPKSKNMTSRTSLTMFTAFNVSSTQAILNLDIIWRQARSSTFRPHYCKPQSHLTSRVQEKFLSQQSRGTGVTLRHRATIRKVAGVTGIF